VSKIYIGKGNALLKLKRNPEAIDSYNARRAVLKSGLAYFNVCAVLYNTGDVNGATTACRKAEAVEPTRATRGSSSDRFSLWMPSPMRRVSSASRRMRQALEKYLELAPDGPHAAT